MELMVVKSLKTTDIPQKRMTLPSNFLNSFPPLSGDKHMADFQVRNECGRVWKFRIYARKRNNKCLKPVLTKGWREFVCSKQLCVGDRVAFYMDKKGDSVRYRVGVEKEVKTCVVSGSTPGCAARVRMGSEAKNSANEEVRRMEMKMEALEEKYSLMENHMARIDSNMGKFLHKIDGSSNILGSEQTNMIREQETKTQNTTSQCSDADEPDDTLCQVMGEEKGDYVETSGMGADRTGVFGSRPGRAALVAAGMASEAESCANEEVRQIVVKMEAMQEKYSHMENHMATMTSNMEKFLHNNAGSSNLFTRVLGRLKFTFWFGWYFSV
ncbi:hypothetical protein V6N13_069501 [Hibiscus sabdariffa]|uniref:TF-B3 domain-containing protein n=1 Tax=Hibiscus sabdariffa TaxID=183260 RepID=A0ABR2PGH6_9ROSI